MNLFVKILRWCDLIAPIRVFQEWVNAQLEVVVCTMASMNYDYWHLIISSSKYPNDLNRDFNPNWSMNDQLKHTMIRRMKKHFKKGLIAEKCLFLKRMAVGYVTIATGLFDWIETVPCWQLKFSKVVNNQSVCQVLCWVRDRYMVQCKYFSIELRINFVLDLGNFYIICKRVYLLITKTAFVLHKPILKSQLRGAWSM